jgi:hypothetical protein
MWLTAQLSIRKRGYYREKKTGRAEEKSQKNRPICYKTYRFHNWAGDSRVRLEERTENNKLETGKL